VSKPIAYDSLLVRALAAELNKRYARQRVRSVRYDATDRLLHVFFRRVTLTWSLDPAAGSLAEIPAFGGPTGTHLPRGTTVSHVHVRPDDRVLEWRLHAPPDRTLCLRVLLLPNRRAAQLTDAHGLPLDATTVAPEREAPDAGDAPPRRGAESAVTEAEFVARLNTVTPTERTRVLLTEFAFTSPINAAAILGMAAAASDPATLAEAYARYIALLHAPAAPVILDPEGVAQPYPIALPGVPSASYPSLLEAFNALRPDAAPAEAVVLESLARRQHMLEKRMARMRDESLHAASEAAELRRAATVLLSHVSAVRRGQHEVTLDDWAGGTVRVPLDPALDAAANASRLFEQARKRERAALRLPALIEKASAETGRVSAMAGRLARGEVTPAEAAALLPAPPRPGPAPQAARLPYRRYRTSGGLEVRVGKNSKANDQLTLRHSSPEDIWMHARDAAGAHVVLRWSRRDENPPAADLAEAAVLAALHSRAATSGAVAVDWTRRKHVRKPRRAKPGLVVVERTRTLFVEPDRRVEERLRRD